MAAQTFLDLPNGAKMPALGLGTWQAQDDAELERALDAAFDCGYRHFDTAYIYENEKAIGNVLQKWFKSGKAKREELFITTKLPTGGVHKDRVEMFLNKSLESLQLDYVDLYLIHFPVCSKSVDGQNVVGKDGSFMLDETDHVAVWKKMEEQVDAGKTKAIGISNFNVRQVARILDIARIKPANLQVELHVYLQQTELVDFCQSKGVTVVAYSPLGSPGYNTFIAKRGFETKPLPNVLEDPDILKIAQKHSKSSAQVMLRFLIQRGIAAIPKSITPNRLKQNIDIFDFELTSEDMKILKGLDKGEDARICDFKVFKGASEHPEFPFSSK